HGEDVVGDPEPDPRVAHGVLAGLIRHDLLGVWIIPAEQRAEDHVEDGKRQAGDEEDQQIDPWAQHPSAPLSMTTRAWRTPKPAVSCAFAVPGRMPKPL